MNKVWLLTDGDGSDGNEWSVISIHRTKEGAEQAKRCFEAPRKRMDGSTYIYHANDIEEWDVLE